VTAAVVFLAKPCVFVAVDADHSLALVLQVRLVVRVAATGLRKALGTAREGACVGPVPGVNAKVSLQVGLEGKALIAAFEGADKVLLAAVDQVMALEFSTLVERLAAAWVLTVEAAWLVREHVFPEHLLLAKGLATAFEGALEGADLATRRSWHGGAHPVLRVVQVERAVPAVELQVWVELELLLQERQKAVRWLLLLLLLVLLERRLKLHLLLLRLIGRRCVDSRRGGTPQARLC